MTAFRVHLDELNRFAFQPATSPFELAAVPRVQLEGDNARLAVSGALNELMDWFDSTCRTLHESALETATSTRSAHNLYETTERSVVARSMSS